MEADKPTPVTPNQSRSLRIHIENASSATLFLNTVTLTSGSWDPQAEPSLGQQIQSASVVRFINLADSAYGDAGGTLSFTLTTEGLFGLTWLWVQGQPIKPRLTMTSSPFFYQLVVSGAQTNSPLIQVVISSLAFMRR